MDKYVKHQFYEHPVIAAVLACHLADNYLKPDDAQATKIAYLERTLKSLTEWLDKLAAKDKWDA